MKKDPVSIKNSDRLNVLVVNCRSIRGKQAEFEHLCRSTNAEIIIGTESWLNETIDSREIFPPNFKVFRKDRCERTGGGVFIAVDCSLDSHIIKNPPDSTESVWCCMRSQKLRKSS